MRTLLTALPLLFAGGAAAETSFADLSIEELSQIRVTSVSRKAEALTHAAASVYVITADDIRRAGVDSLPEALRLAPNLQVARTNSFTYAISARGMNGTQNSTPNKLLVMIDGRSTYSPFFSGVLWDVQDTLLEDIERIEVISGPGGVLWGVNAVNAVINIITSQQATGLLATVNGGNQGGSAAVRYGAGNWRAYARTVHQRHTATAAGTAVSDQRRHTQAGFRGDLALGNDRLTVHGNAYDGRSGQPKPGSIAVTGTTLVLGDIDSAGVNLTAAWTREFADGGALSLQAYLDHTERMVPPTYSQRLDVLDVQLLHTPAAGTGLFAAHQPTWGVNYRVDRDRATNSATVAFLPPHVTQSWASVFAQDEWTLQPALRLTAGARVERNPYTGSEFLPSMRLAWMAGERALLWGGASRTVRAPSRLDVDTYIPGKPPFLLNGGNTVKAEVARVYEIGYRGQPAAGVSAAVTLFQHRYDDLRTQEVAPSRRFVIFASGMEGKATGIEAWGSMQLSPAWRLSGGFTGLNERFWRKPGSNDTASPATAGRDPHHQLQLRSSHTLANGVELDVGLRRIGQLRNQSVPGYTAVDARLGWRISPQWELALVGRNLNGAHAEYGTLPFRAELPRTVGVRLTYRD
jgi:iron complex outermembrane receptor protein